jgi:hypothetical protein
MDPEREDYDDDGRAPPWREGRIEPARLVVLAFVGMTGAVVIMAALGLLPGLDP